MADRTPPRKTSRKQPLIDRRATTTPGDSGSLRKVKGALGRPLGLERREGQLHIVLVERRSTAPADQAPLLAKIRAELRTRLADLIDTPAARLMRHLGFVAVELDRKGWAGVEALPASVVGRAIVQAEMLASEDSSNLLAIFIDRLRLLKAAAEVREERALRLQSLDDATLVVSEATHEEFEESQRSWEASVHAELAPLRSTND